ncbi:hypothetical protein GUK36_29890 [Rhizobium leguminosarum]|uniref:Transposase-like Mu C-terminal domain-containing protein n=1 Tax=Rhizobium leguminosarum TaxID=384 RepID=A0A6P0DMQ4_RHILE|nr:Mu transposase C-terminal domain-containing protein [Rhizobium leguminosarum]MDH6276622.1 putative transposase [Rhizobium leguminosarum]NEK53617.1 hypothetical protein [Rhizobium leguminosarum]
MASNPFGFGPYDRIFLDEVEITIEVDGRDKKAFVRKEGDQRPFIMDNDEIKAALDVGDLVVERNFNDPRRKDLLATTASYVRDLPKRQQEKVGHKLFWIMLLRQMREEMDGIPQDRRPTIMSEIRGRFIHDYKEMKKLAEINEDTRTHYNKLPAIGEPPPYDTVEKWSVKLNKAGGDARALIDGRGSAERVSKFSEEERHLQGRFVWRVCSITEPNVDYLFSVMKAVERRLNKLRPSGMQLDLGGRTTFYNRVNALPDFAIYLGQNGEAKAKAKYNIVIGKDRGLPMDLVEADECRLDIVTLLKIIDVWEDLTEEEQEAYEKAQARFWASAVVDHATGFFLSFRLHVRNPSVHTARAAFELVAINKNQIAKNAGCKSDWSAAVGLRKVRLDCAAWYASDAVITTITDACGSKLHPPVKKPWLRGTMERIFGILSGLTLQPFSGRTFSDVVKRGDRDPRKGASVDPMMLEAVFIRAIVDIYHNKRSTGKLGGMSRRQAWNEGCELKPPPPPPTGWHRRNIYGLNLDRVITSEGIEIMGFFYRSLEIQQMRRDRTGVKVNIRIDLWDLGEITAYDETGNSYRVPARLDRMKGMSYYKATALLHELQVIDVEYTNRTLEHVDAAIEAIDNYADVARMTHSIATPIITEEHVARVQKHITRPLRVVEESEYTRELSAQDYSMVPFLADAWGINDEPEPDDLEVAKSQSAAAVAEKYGETGKSRRKKSKEEPAPNDDAVSADEPPRQSSPIFSARYTEEH